MTDKDIIFPTLELTDWLFEGEGVLEVEDSWPKIHHIKEKDFEKQHQRILVDCKGQVLKVTGNKIIRKENTLFSFLIPPTLIVEFGLQLTGRTMSIDEVKRNVISKSPGNYHITHNKLMTETEYNAKVKAARTFEELFKVAVL